MRNQLIKRQKITATPQSSARTRILYYLYTSPKMIFKVLNQRRFQPNPKQNKINQYFNKITEKWFTTIGSNITFPFNLKKKKKRNTYINQLVLKYVFYLSKRYSRHFLIILTRIRTACIKSQFETNPKLKKLISIRPDHNPQPATKKININAIHQSQYGLDSGKIMFSDPLQNLLEIEFRFAITHILI